MGKRKYAMFTRDKDGNIMGFTEHSFSMGWCTDIVKVWNYPPKHYFHPEHGDFIINLNKEHKDIKVLLDSPIRHNHYFLVEEE